MNVALKQAASEAEYAIQLLKEGNLRFVQNLRQNRNHHHEIQLTKEKQEPFAVVISCMDSRTSPEIIFDRGLGDIFSIRLAGNVVTPEVIGSVEYACGIVGTKVVVVLGHTGCGAIQGTIDQVKLGSLGSITERIRPCVGHGLNAAEVTRKNIEAGIHALKHDSNVLRKLLQQQDLKIIGGIYDITTGTVTFMEEEY